MFVIYDCEYTSWPGAMANNWGEPGQTRDLIQTGAILLDEHLQEVANQTWYVRPARNRQLSAFITELTGVTQAQVDAGLSLPEFYCEFSRFCAGFPAISYGNDMMVIGENIGGYPDGLGHFPLGMMPAMVNIRPYLNTVLPQSAHLNSGRLWDAIGQEPPSGHHEHDALADCRAIAATLRVVTAKRPELLTFLAASRVQASVEPSDSASDATNP